MAQLPAKTGTAAVPSNGDRGESHTQEYSLYFSLSWGAWVWVHLVALGRLGGTSSRHGGGRVRTRTGIAQ